MSCFTAVGIGEILWDILPEGRQLGGAPANFAYHVNALGGDGVPVSRVGDDALGREALARLSENGLSVECITVDPVHPTGMVNVTVDALGVAEYTFPDNGAWDFLALNVIARERVSQADAICFGTLGQRAVVSREAIRDALNTASAAIKVYDINLRQDFYSPELIASSMDMADVIKINDEELAVVSRLFGLPNEEAAALEKLLERFDLQMAVLTRGAGGSLLLSRDNRSDVPGQAVEVVDTIGAGDAFTAAFTLAYLANQPLDVINTFAGNVAAYVCGQFGAMPSLPDHLRLDRLF